MVYQGIMALVRPYRENQGSVKSAKGEKNTVKLHCVASAKDPKTSRSDLAEVIAAASTPVSNLLPSVCAIAGFPWKRITLCFSMAVVLSGAMRMFSSFG